MIRVLFVHGFREFSLAYWTLREAAGRRCHHRVHFLEHGYSMDDVDNQEAFRQKVTGTAPRMVLFSCMAWNLAAFVEAARWVRHYLPGCLIVFGGPQVSSETAAAAVLNAHGWIGGVIRGRGEAPLSTLLNAIGDGDDITKTPAFSFRTPEGIAHTPSAAEPWHRGPLFSADNRELVAALGTARQAAYETMRGCTGRCRYCQYPSLEERPEYLDDELVRRELAFLCTFAIPRIRICDAHFGGTAERAKMLLTHLGQVNRGTSFNIYPDMKHVDDEYIRLVKQARAEITSIGIQSTDDCTLRTIGRKSGDGNLERIRQLLRAFPETPADVIIGLPGGGVTELRTTLIQVRKMGFMRINPFRMTIFPGTELAGDVSGYFGQPVANARNGVILSSPAFRVDKQQEIARLIAAAQLAMALRRTGREIEALDPGVEPIRLLEHIDGQRLMELQSLVDMGGSPMLLIAGIASIVGDVLNLFKTPPPLADALAFDLLHRANLICVRRNADGFDWAQDGQLRRVHRVLLKAKRTCFDWDVKKRSVSEVERFDDGAEGRNGTLLLHLNKKESR